ncbi:MAG: TIGR04211 family SH3 domain-containing protein [Desulfobacterales bacterium]|nr:TIGR04211 family SH3 domain-containing protein [Desulfobacterales bacterium]
MKRLFFLILMTVLFSALVQAETRYVSDLMRITLRTGAGIDYKIIDMLQSGTELEILQPGEQWTLVRTSNGKEGWVLTRFITTTKPATLELKSLREGHNTVKSQAAKLLDENKSLKSENEKLSAQFSTTQKKFDELYESHETLKRESAEFFNLKSNNQKAVSQLTAQTKKLQKYEEDLNRLQMHHNIQWFLSGAGVLIIGFVIGYNVRRPRRRTSLY